MHFENPQRTKILITDLTENLLQYQIIRYNL